MAEMSELIEYPKSYVYDQLGNKPRGNLYYLKYDADKVIDFWKNESHNHYERWFNLNKQYEGWFGKVCRCERAERQLRHYKYKHCLDMADKCVQLCHKAKDLYRWAEDENLECYYNHRIEFFARWHNRWLKIAEQFKEAK